MNMPDRALCRDLFPFLFSSDLMVDFMLTHLSKAFQLDLYK